MTMFKRLVLIALCLMLAACGRAPDADALRTDVNTALATTYGEGLFRITDLKRRGSAADSNAPPGESRRVVYYDVELTLGRDIALGAWDQPGAASLVTLLGAGPRSIIGVKSGGNQAGDRLVAHASAIYRQEGDTWKRITPAGFKAAEAPSLDTGAPPPVTRRLLDALDQITHSVAYNASSTAQNVVQQELERSVARINGRLARLQQGYPLAGGPDGGEYVAFARALSAVARARQIRVTPLITGGGAENIALLRSGDAVVGLAQADTARLAYEGRGPFAAQGPFGSLRALGSLYPELVHIVVRDDPALQGVRDLKGKTIALGPEGSAVRATLEAVLAAHGLQPGRDYTVADTPFATSLPALNAGTVDAAAQVIGVPATPLRDALTQAQLKLLPLDPAAIKSLTASNSDLMPLEIAAGTYPNQSAPVTTVGTAALLLTTANLTRDEALVVVRAVYQTGQDLLAAGSTQGAQVSVANARRGLSVPLHDGAEEGLAGLEHAKPH
ncbi:TAXI family TRAP transporter solute-binding subunit [Achromobacter spanius]|uniref:TRAP ABC transporter substrate-binding protein n=1 Tax=Achromobacter spanius TaxID=217203 RepID=A0AAW3I090_9BURK|nr:TAXI family TRAP transporter solute-binding subunit [Achromobacter spanius]KNE25302.1 TRAP ABC transporter substrate-binding protein [Achromobacter spanius]MCW3156072.1 TAXI family TRAP transporter solute-binding subunit [Achromobacter spanius]